MEGTADLGEGKLGRYLSIKRGELRVMRFFVAGGEAGGGGVGGLDGGELGLERRDAVLELFLLSKGGAREIWRRAVRANVSGGRLRETYCGDGRRRSP